MSPLNNNSDWDIDLPFGQVFERKLVDALVGNIKIEVKTEREKWKTSGNFYLEYESRGNPSGIAVSKAEYYFIFLSETENTSKLGFLLDTNVFKSWVKANLVAKRFKLGVPGGDDGTSKGVLIPINRLHEVAKHEA